MKQNLSVVGIDLAKSIFHLVGMDERGKIILRKRLMRGDVLSFMAKLPRVTIGMEACGGSHYWARRLREQGHEVKVSGAAATGGVEKRTQRAPRSAPTHFNLTHCGRT